MKSLAHYELIQVALKWNLLAPSSGSTSSPTIATWCQEYFKFKFKLFATTTSSAFWSVQLVWLGKLLSKPSASASASGCVILWYPQETLQIKGIKAYYKIS
jgi:hypothetical protein